MARIELVGVTKRYGGVTALNGVSLTIKDNEFFCIFGPPTSGKTTLLRLLLGLETPDAGEIRINGRDVTKMSAASRQLAMVFQNLALFPHLTARENLRFPLARLGRSDTEISERVDMVAAKLHISHILHKPPGQLSGGERQRVAIGRALVRDPNAYLMDDPISALDARLREEMRIELKRLQREVDKTLIYVTHDQEEAMSVADRMAILNNGQVQQIGTPRQIYQEPDNRFVACLVGQPAMNFVSGQLDGLGKFSASEVDWQVSAPQLVRHKMEVQLAFRPERVNLVDPATAEKHTLRATVFECEPLGAQTIITARAGKTLLKLAMQGQHTFALEQPLALHVPTEDRFYFDAANGKRLPGVQ